MFDLDSNSGISCFKLLKTSKSSKEELIPKLSDQLSAHKRLALKNRGIISARNKHLMGENL